MRFSLVTMRIRFSYQVVFLTLLGFGLLTGLACDGQSDETDSTGEANQNGTLQSTDGAAQSEDGTEKMSESTKNEVAVIDTPHGEIVIRFFPETAPQHVASFKKLAREGFYNGTIFHRVIPGFMIQGGDPNTKDKNNTAAYGTGGPGYSIPAEFSDLPHRRGIVSAARSQDPNSAGSQFFIVVADSPHLNGQYTVFGEVISGMDVADKIVNEPRNPRDLPNRRMEITVRIEER